MIPPVRHLTAARVLFLAYAALLIALAIGATLHPWTDPLDDSQALPTVALAAAAPAAVIPLVVAGVGGVLDTPEFNALVVLVALAEVALVHRAARARARTRRSGEAITAVGSWTTEPD
ncbi:hypothetical protein [Kitasatospora atroaurantiaca]|uniref:Uncharacterized protein n=1 Tax=Kitasatospora atroaurantiaca TaxID=285545 RepID=A0A561EUM9_9ACTN|nr:hypothetical protein [Kitasatospora atroaurantiaca]TWE19287.1 hypothetical protein FB465_4403 [Kitasatospora atroaurantiaca]